MISKNVSNPPLHCHTCNSILLYG